MSKITSRDGVKFKIGRTKTLMTIYQNSPIPKNRKSKDKSSSSKQEKNSSSMPSAYSEINYKRRNQKRATAIKEICSNNFHIGSMMITLTFDPILFRDKDITNIETAYAEFKRFIKRMNNHYENFIYIATFSKQENGNCHYHMMCNLDAKTSESDINEIWGNGGISINLIRTHKHFIKEVNYLIKNMKEISEELKGKRGYLCSKNVERDIIVDSENILQAEKYDKIREKL